MSKRDLIRVQRNRANRHRPWRPSARFMQIYEAHALGTKTNTEIAEQFQISLAMVSKIVRKTGDWIARESLDNIRRLKSIQQVRLESIYKEAMQAWHRSYGTVVRKTVGSRDGDAFESTVTEEKAGASTFLDTAMKALDEIRKLWGGNVPEAPDFSDEWRIAGKSRIEILRMLTVQYTRILEQHDAENVETEQPIDSGDSGPPELRGIPSPPG